MRRLLSTLTLAVAVVLAGAAVAAEEPAEAEAPILIRFSHVVAEETPKGQGALLFRRLVEERLAGKVEVRVHPNSSLYGDAKEMEALLLGEVEMLAPSLSKLYRYSPALQLFDLPFLFDNMAALDRFQNSPDGRELLRSVEPRGLLGLAFWHNGMKQLTANKPLRQPADAAGLRFRIQSSAVLEAQFETLGAKAVKLPFSEVLHALKRGYVDGQENTWSNMWTQRFFEAQKYVTETNHGVIDYIVVTNARFWNGLPEGIRTALEAILDEVTAEVNRQADAINEAARQSMLAGGKIQLVALDKPQRAAWREAMRPVWRRFEGEIGTERIAEALAANRR